MYICFKTSASAKRDTIQSLFDLVGIRSVEICQQFQEKTSWFSAFAQRVLNIDSP